MKLKVVAFFFCSVIFTVAFADSAKIDFWSDIPPEPLSKKLVESMGDEELLAQILMFFTVQVMTDNLYSYSYYIIIRLF